MTEITPEKVAKLRALAEPVKPGWGLWKAEKPGKVRSEGGATDSISYAFRTWLPRAYRQPVNKDARIYTRWNMEVAFRAGTQHELGYAKQLATFAVSAAKDLGVVPEIHSINTVLGCLVQIDSAMTSMVDFARKGSALEEACEPWEHCAGDPPDWDSPLHKVFVAGMLYSEKLLCGVVGVERYEPGDGSEDFDADASKSLQNILTAAGLYDEETGTWAKLPGPYACAREGKEERLREALDAFTRTLKDLEEAKRERDEARQCDAITALRSPGPAEEEV